MIRKEGWVVQLQVRISIMRYNRIHGLGNIGWAFRATIGEERGPRGLTTGLGNALPIPLAPPYRRPQARFSGPGATLQKKPRRSGAMQGGGMPADPYFETNSHAPDRDPVGSPPMRSRRWPLPCPPRAENNAWLGTARALEG
jgi:hypothetical protein